MHVLSAWTTPPLLPGESFLKLPLGASALAPSALRYVFFNMLELAERWLRSVGVDLFDLLAASCRQPCQQLVPKYLAAPRCEARSMACPLGLSLLLHPLLHAHAAPIAPHHGHQHLLDA